MIPVKYAPDFQPEESFESYLNKWPAELDNIPNCVIEQWCYRHNDQFIESWSSYNPEKWSFELVRFDNDMVYEIGHLKNELNHYDHVGRQYIKYEHTRDFVGTYMLNYGTFPQPIIVAVDGGKLEHPRSRPGELMKEPYHLIEGHRRLGMLREMIRQGQQVSKVHPVWLMSFNT